MDATGAQLGAHVVNLGGEPEPVNVPGSVQRHEPEGLDLGPSGAAEDAWSEAKRLAENERFKVWEAGFKAGMKAMNGELPQNPYQYHGVTE
jgi:hypothetical protein